MSAEVDSAFLTLVTHGSDLIRKLDQGDIRYSPGQMQAMNAFKAAMSHAQNIVPRVNMPEVSAHSGGVFDGGPIANPPGGTRLDAPPPPPSSTDTDAEEFRKGQDLARSGEPLPENVSKSFRDGYYKEKPPFGDPAAKEE